MKRHNIISWLRVAAIAIVLFMLSLPARGASLIISTEEGSNLSLTWDANPEPDIQGYRIYYGLASRSYTSHVDLENVTTGVIHDLVAGLTYFIALTAYNTAGVESLPSEEISYTVSGVGSSPTPTPTPPSDVTPTPTPTPSPSVSPTPNPTATPTPQPSATPVPTASPTPTPLHGLTFGATQGVITTPFKRNTDNTISQMVETVEPSHGGKAVYAFTITNAGSYIVTMNVKAPSTGANSLFATMDGEPVAPTMIWDTPVSSTFQNRTVTWRGTGGVNPKVWSLSAGVHQLVLRGREANLKVKQITISQHNALSAPDPTPPPARRSLLNVSTRIYTQSGEDVMIGGFIITGDSAKKVIIRGLGPSLAQAGVTGAMADPTLELHDSRGILISSNDNWTSNRSAVEATGVPPTNNREAAIVTTLQPGNYTCVLQSKTGTPGVALFELYDLDAASSHLVNISTRGKVGVGEKVVIGGFIIGGDQPTKVLIRAIGPSLARSHISNALQDPKLELHGPTGALIFSNDNWRTSQHQQIAATTIPPTDNREAAIVANLSPGHYTAIVRGAGNATGVALVEVYNLSN